MPPDLRTFCQPTPLPSTPRLRALGPPIDYDKPLGQRLEEAKQWLEDNPVENVATASRLYILQLRV
jgi:hypothetical protein